MIKKYFPLVTFFQLCFRDVSNCNTHIRRKTHYERSSTSVRMHCISGSSVSSDSRENERRKRKEGSRWNWSARDSFVPFLLPCQSTINQIVSRNQLAISMRFNDTVAYSRRRTLERVWNFSSVKDRKKRNFSVEFCRRFSHHMAMSVSDITKHFQG